MCITKVSSYEFAGKLYPTEMEAVNAAITHIAKTLMEFRAENMANGLKEHAEYLVQVLTIYTNRRTAQTAAEVTSVVGQREPIDRDDVLVKSSIRRREPGEDS